MANLKDGVEHISSAHQDRLEVIGGLKDICKELSELTEVFDSEQISRFEYDYGYYSCALEHKIDVCDFDRGLLVVRKALLESV